ncbi:MAG: hypothetical protein K6F95_11485 [Selenomonas sp.]|uniref:hypothetical protein n=1 Tax=Selenomonas sp. TaxID=2053611 RepID=UPI0025F50C4C|nr:hypothetical protein [Selenomonas sp.]MCR5758512.1 hypothetical protein [Selenomonas sp.]
MEITALQSTGAWIEPEKNTDNSGDRSLQAKGQFSKMLRQLETGGGITDTGEGQGDEETTTVIQVMSDGSVLITVYAGDKLVSQTKTHAANAEENPTILSTQVEKSGPLKDGEAQANLLETQAAGLSAVQMLNMLIQK